MLLFPQEDKNYYYYHYYYKPFESWTIHYKGLQTLLAKRRLNLVLCGFSHLCFAWYCPSCVLFGNQMWEEKTLCISLILEGLFCVSVGRHLPELSNPESKMMLTWSQPPRGTVWCCNMRGLWGKNLTRRCCICSPFSFLMLPFTSVEAGAVATISCTSYSHSVWSSSEK